MRRDQKPLVSTLGLSQWKSGRTSAPRLPQAAQTTNGSRSDSLPSIAANRDVNNEGKEC